jgi:hypothetical protein
MIISPISGKNNVFRQIVPTLPCVMLPPLGEEELQYYGPRRIP